MTPGRSSKRNQRRPRPNYAGLDLSTPGLSAYSQEHVDHGNGDDEFSTDESVFENSDSEQRAPKRLKIVDAKPMIHSRTASTDKQKPSVSGQQSSSISGLLQSAKAMLNEEDQVDTQRPIQPRRSNSVDSVIVIDSSEHEDQETTTKGKTQPAQAKSAVVPNRRPTPDSVVDEDSSEDEPLVNRRSLARASFKNFSKKAPIPSTGNTTEDELPLLQRSTSRLIQQKMNKLDSPQSAPETLGSGARGAASSRLALNGQNQLSSDRASDDTASLGKKQSFIVRLRVSPPTSKRLAPDTEPSVQRPNTQTPISKFLPTLSLVPDAHTKYPQMTSMKSMMEEIYKLRAQRELEKNSMRSQVT